MGKKTVTESGSFIKERLEGGLLCCILIAGAYLMQYIFPGMHVDAYSSSFYFFLWMLLFVGAVLWTIREKGTRGLPTVVTDWQCIAAFLLVVGDQAYKLLPNEIHSSLAPVISAYALPLLVVVSILIAGLIKFSITGYRLLENERKKSALEIQRLQEIIATPPPPPTEMKNGLFCRRLILNESIAQLNTQEMLVLIEECRVIDPAFFVWLRDKKQKLQLRDIVYFVLIRLGRTREEIKSIFQLNDTSYRVMKSRSKGRLGIEEEDLRTFLLNIK